MFCFGRFELQAEQRRLLANGHAVDIGARALDVLTALAQRRDRVVTKSELLDLVWPGLVVEENNLQVQVSSLRKLLGPGTIATIPGRGYRFTARLLDSDAPGSSAEAPPSMGREREPDALPNAPLSNLPGELPPLYGRADDLAILRSLVESHRLVDIVGAGGIGKTALAQSLGHALRSAFDDGAWLVRLAPVSDPAQLASTVASSVGLSLGSASTIEGLVRTLATSRMLIVLDNCEHLVDAVAQLAAALHGGAPGVHVLATSQEPLKIAAERVLRLSGLNLPRSSDVASARQAGAVILFEARARAAHPSFALSSDNVEAVVDICRQLDGIALAIELAAARLPLLGVAGLHARLGERLRLLTAGDRLAERRHRTLRAALDWSHDLLSPDEQIVFRRLGVFVGGFGLESAQLVCADARIDEWAVLDHLGALVDKSLVVAEAGNEARYRLLETNRVFALEQLEQADETAALRRRHAEAVLAVFERSLEDEFVVQSSTRLQRYLPDLDNARAALDASAAGEDASLHIALAGAVGWIWSDAGAVPGRIARSGRGTRWHASARPPRRGWKRA